VNATQLVKRLFVSLATNSYVHEEKCAIRLNDQQPSARSQNFIINELEIPI
jgi:hypothetical protein